MKLLTRKQHIQNYKSKTAAGRKTVVSSGLMTITNEPLELVRVGVEIHRVHMHTMCLQANNKKHGDNANCWRHAQGILRAQNRHLRAIRIKRFSSNIRTAKPGQLSWHSDQTTDRQTDISRFDSQQKHGTSLAIRASPPALGPPERPIGGVGGGGCFPGVNRPRREAHSSPSSSEANNL
jgi:hypothetical protein